MSEKYEYKFGDWVYCKCSCKFKYIDDNIRGVEYTTENVHGRIIGATYRSVGIRDTYIDGRTLWEPGEEVPYLNTECTYLVWQLRSSMTGKIIEALPEDIHPCLTQQWKWKRSAPSSIDSKYTTTRDEDSVRNPESGRPR